MLLRHARWATLAVACAFSSLFSISTSAAELGNITLSPSQRVVTLPPRTYNMPNASATLKLTCNAQLSCDYANLTVNLPADWRTLHGNDKLRISASWPTRAVNDDFDLML